jgi:GT2 family glycosyltransferase
MIATLIYNTPELVEKLRAQIPDIFIIDAGSTIPIQGANLRYDENRYWVGNWDRFLRSIDADYVWMLNSDVEGVSKSMYLDLVDTMLTGDLLMITPAFNSPHSLFHKRKTYLTREVNWVDMTCPIINVDMYKKLGGFDLQFKGYFADVDLCYRARLAGLIMAIDDIQEVNHIGSYTVQKEDKWEQANASDNELIVKKWGKNWTELCL